MAFVAFYLLPPTQQGCYPSPCHLRCIYVVKLTYSEPCTAPEDPLLVAPAASVRLRSRCLQATRLLLVERLKRSWQPMVAAPAQFLAAAPSLGGTSSWTAADWCRLQCAVCINMGEPLKYAILLRTQPAVRSSPSVAQWTFSSLDGASSHNAPTAPACQAYKNDHWRKWVPR